MTVIIRNESNAVLRASRENPCSHHHSYDNNDIFWKCVMFGIEDPLVLIGYLLCLVSACGCVIYGLVMRYRGDEAMDVDDAQWEQEERKTEDRFT
jgi:hypothetical protein